MENENVKLSLLSGEPVTWTESTKRPDSINPTENRIFFSNRGDSLYWHIPKVGNPYWVVTSRATGRQAYTEDFNLLHNPYAVYHAKDWAKSYI